MLVTCHLLRDSESARYISMDRREGQLDHSIVGCCIYLVCPSSHFIFPDFRLISLYVSCPCGRYEDCRPDAWGSLLLCPSAFFGRSWTFHMLSKFGSLTLPSPGDSGVRIYDNTTPTMAIVSRCQEQKVSATREPVQMNNLTPLKLLP